PDHGGAGHECGETAGQPALVQAESAGPDDQAPTLVHLEIQVNGQVLVRTQVVDDAFGRVVHHLCVEPPGAAGQVEGADEADRLPAVRVDVRVVLDGERH